ncbi:TKL protein kinase [Phytophthora nicotianae]|uniref:TKL protein kinase n=1 Tax=Phytophthora nicotianae TaxID=4792 RepID=W2LZL5_PHYNI|nr:TKL protein kinase [Phytophthora nicotianae]ETM02031.1 TKL protein kinase [Phytophthora nicotianae]
MFDLAGCDKEILAILQNHLQEHIEHLMNSIPELCGSMMELRQMSEHLLIRLQAARIQLQQTKDTTQASSMGFYSIIKTFHSLLLQHSKKLALERLVSARIVADGVRQLHSNLDALLDQHGLELHSPLQHRDWQGQWDKDEGDAYKHIVAILENDAEGVPRELNSTTRQENVLKLLRYESEEHGNYYDTTMMNIFKSAQLKLVRFSGLAVPEVPNWFLPEYEVQRHPTPFAHGSFGNVFKGTWLGSQVVVKCVDPKTEEDKRTFRREARIWQRARHRHVITFFGACDQGSPWFFVCEEAANGNLKNYLYHQKNKGRSLAWRKLYEAALGLHFLHQRQIIHCDLKCNQILVSAEGVAMLTDFGLSFMSVDSRPLTPPGGAVRWKAPECLNNSNHVPTKESDVYSFGMCVVEAVTGEYPWGNCPDPAVVFQMKRGLVFPRPKAFVDNEQWQFVQALCAPDPSKRLKMPDAIHLLKKFADQEQMQEWSSKAEDHEFD